MTNIEPTQPAEQLVLPHTGEVLDLGKPRDVAYAIDELRAYVAQLHELRARLETQLLDEFTRQGTKTLHFDTFTATLTGGEKTEYDAEQLAHELRRLGLPEDRIAEAIVETVSYKPDGRVLRQLAGANLDYRDAIEANKTTVPAAYRVTIKR